MLIVIAKRLKIVVALTVISLGPIGGCAEEFGPERFETARVEGVVTIAGRPVTSGWIEFVPVEGTMGNLRTAQLGPDGRYTAERVAAGRVAIGFTDLKGPPIRTAQRFFPLAEFRFQTTPIRKSIPPGSRLRLDIDLAVEARGGSSLRSARRPPTKVALQ